MSDKEFYEAILNHLERFEEAWHDDHSTYDYSRTLEAQRFAKAKLRQLKEPGKDYLEASP
jgi:hypothetical protein